MKKTYLLLIFLLLTKILLAQSSDLEELSPGALKKRLTESKTDTDRVVLQLALGRVIIDKPDCGKAQLDTVLMLANRSARLSQEIGYQPGIINSMILSVLYWNKKGFPAKGFQLAQQTLVYAKKVNNRFGMAEAYIVMGHHYDVSTLDGLVKRMEYNNKALAIFRKDQMMLRLTSLLKDNAELLFLAQQKTEAVKLLFEALSTAKSIGYKRVHSIYWLIGRTSVEMGDFPNAMKYNLLAVKTAKDVNDSTLQLCSIYHSMAATYSTMGDYDRAIPYSLQALEVARRYNNIDYIGTVAMALASSYTRTNRLDKALELLYEVKKTSKTDLDNLFIMNNFLTNLTYAKQFNAAESYAREVRRLLAKISENNYDLFRGSYAALAQYYLKSRQYDYARYYNDRYAAIVNKLNSSVGIRMTEKRYFELDSIKGDFRSAIRHYLIAQRIKDSIDNITKAYQVSVLQIENDTEKKNSHIDTLTKQAQIKDSQLKRNQIIQNMIAAGAVLLLIITGLIYSRYRLKQRSNALLLTQKTEIDQQNISLQHLIVDKNQLISDKDELLYEKDLLLKEVNHRVKNNLQIVMSLLASQSGNVENKKVQEAIQESQNRVQAIALIHDQLYNTDKITEIELSPYIHELVYALNGSINKSRSKILIHCEVDKILLDVAQAIPVGIILNEAVTNALKYAFPGDRSGEIRIIVRQLDQQVQMHISDNGIGLPTDFSLSAANSLGITLIKGLTSQLKGKINIKHSPGFNIRIKFMKESSITATVAD